MTTAEIRDIAHHIDHTCLSSTATTSDIVNTCLEAYCVEAASVCIPPCYVKEVRNILDEVPDRKPKVCTVIGFPHGYNSTAVKVFEIQDAINNGAEEVDAVVNIGFVKSRARKSVLKDVSEMVKAAKTVTFKLIVETAYLTEEEIVWLCQVCKDCGVDYIKTSTGFAPIGATIEAVQAMKAAIEDAPLKIKASGGISTIEQAKEFMSAGADRIGASKIIPVLIKEGIFKDE